MSKYIKLLSVAISLILVLIAVNDWMEYRRVQAVESQEIELLNEQLIEEELQERQTIKEEKLKQEVLDNLTEEEIAKIRETIPRVLCWGDELTRGVGGNGTNYPMILSMVSKLTVANYGVEGENVKLVGYRQGAFSIITNEFIIPEEIEPVEMKLMNSDLEELEILTEGSYGFNPCTINDVEGRIIYNKEKSVLEFTKTVTGPAVEVSEGTQVYSHSMNDVKDDDILIIFNGVEKDAKEKDSEYFIDIYNGMIEHANTDNYIILGTINGANTDNINKALLEEYDVKYLEVDSLLSDGSEINEIFYEALGNKVYDKILELGYLNDEQIEALSRNY